MNKDFEVEYKRLSKYFKLESAGWTYLGCDEWRDVVTGEKFGTSAAYKVLVQRVEQKARPPKWRRDSMGDYVIEVNITPMVRGRIVRCPIVTRFAKRFWRTKSRWLLIVNDHTYGFWNKLSEAVARFEKDCIPKPPSYAENPKACDDDDLDPEYCCWHGDKPFGPGPYCTGCGGLIKKS